MEKLKEIGQSVTGVKKKMANWAKGVALRGNMNLEKGYVEIGAIKIIAIMIIMKIIIQFCFIRVAHYSLPTYKLTNSALDRPYLLLTEQS